MKERVRSNSPFLAGLFYLASCPQGSSSPQIALGGHLQSVTGWWLCVAWSTPPLEHPAEAEEGEAPGEATLALGCL